MAADPLRDHLVALLTWKDAHVGFEDAVAGVPVEMRAVAPPGMPYTLWQLVEHLRITQRDILDFCAPEAYVELAWPADYWPAPGHRPSEGEWAESVAGYLADRHALVALARDASLDLLAVVPNGSGGQTYLRELLLVADHNAYHIGELVAARRALGVWPER